MKLSRVKRICLDHGELVVKRAQSGLDVSTWIGARHALFPVHGLEINLKMAINIWELDQKKLKNLYTDEDTEEKGECFSLIRRVELESMPPLIAVDGAEDLEAPGLMKVCTLNEKIILMDRETKKGWWFWKDMLEPVEGGEIRYHLINEDTGRNVVGIYAGGKLEAVIWCMPIDNREEVVGKVIESLSEIYAESIGGEKSERA